MKEIHIIMTCSWRLTIPYDGTTWDSQHEVHSAWSSKRKANHMAKFYKRDDEVSGLYNTKYWVVSTSVETQIEHESEL